MPGPVALAFVFVLGTMVGALVATQLVAPSKDAAKSQERGASAEAPTAQEGEAPRPPQYGNQLTGAVSVVGDRSVTLKDVIAPPADGGKEQPSTREVLVGAGTKIVLLALKDQVTFQKEVAAYQASKSGTQPAMYQEKPIALSGLKPGMKVAVMADHDVRTEASFTATSITVTYDPSPPADAGAPPGAPAPKTDSSGNPIPAEGTAPKSAPPTP